MARIILYLDGVVLQEMTLSKERVMIGRHASNDLVIENRAISGEHAVIVTILHDSFLEDLNSTNGTLVNGHPIKKHFLQNGDIVELAKYKLHFFADAPRAVDPAAVKAPSIPALAKTPVRSPDTGATNTVMAGNTMMAGNTVLAGGGRPPNPQQDLPKGVIKVLNGVSAGKELTLTKPLTTLGRPGVQVAVISRQPQGYYITHVEGSAFPLVNGVSIGTAPRLMVDADVLELSGTRMAFSIEKLSKT